MAAHLFVPEHSIRDQASKVFERHRAKILQLLPNAEVEHVGGTSVPEAVTKGDVDLSIRVPMQDFQNAIRSLESAYAIHQPANWTPTYASFKDDDGDLPVGVQLTARGSPDDHFVAIRDLLRMDTELLSQYNALKIAYQNEDQETYVAAKANFMENLVRERLPNR